MSQAPDQSVELLNVVGGELRPAADGRTTAVVDPSTGREYARAPLSGAADVDAAYASASQAFTTWGRTTPAERQLALLRLADAVEARADEFVAVESRNTGKPLHLTATDEVPPCVDQLRFFAGAARVLDGLSAGEYMAGHTSWVRREPVGVVGQVTPWNYPLMMAIWKIAPALAAGNTVVLKPSDTTPASTLLLGQVAAEVLPPGVLNVDLRRPRRPAARWSRTRGPTWWPSPARCAPARRSPRPPRPTSSACTSSSAARRR